MKKVLIFSKQLPLLALLLAVASVCHYFNLAAAERFWLGDVLLSVYWVYTAQFLYSLLLVIIAAVYGAKLFHPIQKSFLSLDLFKLEPVRNFAVISVLCAYIPTAIAQIYTLSHAAWISSYKIFEIILLNVVIILGALFLSLMGLYFGARFGIVNGTLAAIAIGAVAIYASYINQAPLLELGGQNSNMSGLELSLIYYSLQVIFLISLVYFLYRTIFSTANNNFHYLSTIALAIIAINIFNNLIHIEQFKLTPDLQAYTSCYTQPLGDHASPETKLVLCTRADYQHLANYYQEAWVDFHSQLNAAGIKYPKQNMVEVPVGISEDHLNEFNLDDTVLFSVNSSHNASPESIDENWVISNAYYPIHCPQMWSEEPPDLEIFETLEEIKLTYMALGAPEANEKFKLLHEKYFNEIDSCKF